MSNDRPETASTRSDDGRRRLRVRRAPRYPVFLVTGTVVGVVTALVAGLSGPTPTSMGRGPLVGYLSVALGLFGALLGAIVALLLDRRRR